MTLGTLTAYSDTGRVRASAYAYLLLCKESNEAICVKIGRSVDPYRRMAELIVACPMLPSQLATCSLRTVAASKKLEESLLAETRKWHSHGEWRRVPLSDKQDFNARLKSVLAAHSDYAWPLSWTMHSVSELQKLAAQRKAAHWRKVRARGAAYLDFIRDSA